jgi:pyruvate formate lyase activating enzyme
MPFHKITYNEKYRFATLHNFGCTFRCPICSYKLRSGADGSSGQSWPRPEKFLTVAEMKTALRSVPLDTVFFMGGEPTLATELPEMLDFVKNSLGAKTSLGHTNGSRLPLPNLDAAAHRAGMELKANVVFVPGLVDLDQIEAIAAWIASLNRAIPFHIMGYIPVPGQPYQRPTTEQMERAVAVCRSHLDNVAMSHLTVKEALDLSVRDDRFEVRRIA